MTHRKNPLQDLGPAGIYPIHDALSDDTGKVIFTGILPCDNAVHEAELRL